MNFMKKLLASLAIVFLASTNVLIAEEAAPVPAPAANAAAPAAATPAPAAQPVPAMAKEEVKAPVEEKAKPPRMEVKSVEGSYFTRSVDRLGHGFGNVAYSPLEIPYQIGKDLERTNPVSAIIAGSIKGVTWFALRAVAGAIEVGTFLIPIQPLVRDFDTGWFNM